MEVASADRTRNPGREADDGSTPDSESLTPAARPVSPFSGILLLLLRVYQKTAVLRRPMCRFYPSCSQYAIEAIRKYGAARGAWMATKRLCRCHPLHPGGYDPVR